MKQFPRFFFRLLIATRPLLLALGYTEYHLRGMRTNYDSKRMALESQLDRIEVLSVGSSSAFYGINPAGFDYPGFNLGYLAQSMYYDEALVLKYLKRMPRLKVVLLPAIYFTMGTDHTKPAFSEYWRMYFYRQFYGIQLEANSDQYCDWGWLIEPKNFSRFALFGDKSYDYITNRFQDRLDVERTTNTGWLNSTDIPPARLEDKVGPNGADAHNRTDPALYPKNLAYWGKLVVALQKRNITPVIIRMPVHSSYYLYLDPGRAAFLNKTLRDFAQQHQLEYHDYTKDRRFVLDDFTMYVDHLSVKGAEKFSKIINDDILIPATHRAANPVLHPSKRTAVTSEAAKGNVPSANNAPPVITSPDTMNAWIGQPAMYTATATNQASGYGVAWVKPLAGAADFDEITGTFQITPDQGRVGTYTFELFAYNDAGVGAKKTVSLVVRTQQPSGAMENRTPTGTNISFGQPILLHWEGSAPNGNLAYIMTRIGGKAEVVFKTDIPPATEKSFADSGPWGTGYTWMTTGTASQMAEDIAWLPSAPGSYLMWGHVRTTDWDGKPDGAGVFNTPTITFVVDKAMPVGMFGSRHFIAEEYILKEDDFNAVFSNQYSEKVAQPTGKISYILAGTGESLRPGMRLPLGTNEIIASFNGDANHNPTTVRAIFTITRSP